MAKTAKFQDLPLAPPRGVKELWRWLRDELRAASGLVLGFAGCAPGELRRGVQVLASVLG